MKNINNIIKVIMAIVACTILFCCSSVISFATIDTTVPKAFPCCTFNLFVPKTSFAISSISSTLNYKMYRNAYINTNRNNSIICKYNCINKNTS